MAARSRHLVQTRRNLETGTTERVAIEEQADDHRCRYVYEGKEWFSMALSALKVLRQAKAAPSAWSVYAYIVEHISKDNTFLRTQGEIAEVLGVQRQAVNIALKQLNELRLIIPTRRVAGLVEWSLNPRYAFKGSAKAQNQAVNDMRPARPRLAYDATKPAA